MTCMYAVCVGASPRLVHSPAQFLYALATSKQQQDPSISGFIK